MELNFCKLHFTMAGYLRKLGNLGKLKVIFLDICRVAPVLGYDAVWAENRTDHLLIAERMRFVLRLRRGSIFLFSRFKSSNLFQILLMDSCNNEVEFERATLAGRYVFVEHSILHKNQTNKHFVKNKKNISFYSAHHKFLYIVL